MLVWKDWQACCSNNCLNFHTCSSLHTQAVIHCLSDWWKQRLVDWWLEWRSGHIQNINHWWGASMFRKRHTGTAGDDLTPEPLKIIHLTDWRERERAKENSNKERDKRWRKTRQEEWKTMKGGRGSVGAAAFNLLHKLQKIKHENATLKLLNWWKRITVYTKPHVII